MNNPLASISGETPSNYERLEDDERVKILVVDDIRANIIAIEHLLSDLDADLITTTDPYEALTYTFKYDFALVLLDVQMPKLDGYQTAEMMQSAEHSRQIPIVFVTANSLDESNVARGYNVGAIDYITKPLNPYILRSKVNVFVELYKSKKSLKVLNHELSLAKGAAENASQLKSELIANLSFELKTPMHSILGLSDMGMLNFDRWGKVQHLNNLGQINSYSRDLLLLLNDLIDLSKLEAGLMSFEFTANDIVKVVCDVIKSLKPLLYEKNISVAIERSLESIFSCFDVPRLSQVLLNLFLNAIKVTPENGTIDVDIFGDNDPDDACKVVRVSITDYGSGIPLEAKEVLLGKFVKGVGSDGESNSAGLGLAICREIINAHNGAIWAENGEECGAVVSFEIPVKATLV